MPNTILLKDPAILSTSKYAFNNRVASIDILRALTMVLMIFVNDLWSLKDIPEWLEHVKPGVDGIGLADVVFPAFLFIVGLSLPYAIDYRRKKGDSDLQLVVHVMARTIALLIMGVFLVNGESINTKATGIPNSFWYPLSCLSFILIWNVYPKTAKKIPVLIARAAGVVILIALAMIYRGGDDGNTRFATHWWGILGLIGWAYLPCALLTIFSRNNFYLILGGWIFFSIVSMAAKAGYIPHNTFVYAIPDAIRGGTLAGLTVGGVLTTIIFRYYRERNDNRSLTLVFLAFSAVLIALSMYTRPFWKLAKLGATPAWLFLCSAFTILAFTAIYWLADVINKTRWFDAVKPAGTDTLLCYLVPYFLYALASVSGLYLPTRLLTGGIGLLKSFLFALLCVVITGWLNKAGIKLKL